MVALEKDRLMTGEITMSEEAVQGTEAKTKRVPPEVVTVEMSDGRMVPFTGKAKMLKDVDAEAGKVRFDFRNGETRSFDVEGSTLLLRLACHGASQKIGDETAGEDDVDDMVLAVDSILERLGRGEWGAVRARGDGFAGASIVLRAMAEATGKPIADVKAFFENKLKAAQVRGETLTRKDLYDSVRKPGTKTGDIIARLENEKKAKAAKFDGDELANELAGG